MDELIQYQTGIIAESKGFEIPHIIETQTFSKGWAAEEYVASFNPERVLESKIDTILRANPGGEYVATVKLKQFYILPTQTAVQRWLREKHYLHISVQLRYKSDDDQTIGWYYDIEHFNVAYLVKGTGVHFEWIDSGTDFHTTFESALEQGLLKTMELI